jgi:hypothetical protein
MNRIARILVVVSLFAAVAAAFAYGADEETAKPQAAKAQSAEISQGAEAGRLTVPVSTSATAEAIAAKVPEEADTEPEEKMPIKEKAEKITPELYSKEALIKRINSLLQHHPDALKAVPGLEAKKEGSAVIYLYQGRRLEELQKEVLEAIMRAINNYINMKTMQATQRQLKNLKDIENMNRTQRMLADQRRQQAMRQQGPAKIYTPPKTYKPPSVPKTK